MKKPLRLGALKREELSLIPLQVEPQFLVAAIAYFTSLTAKPF